MDKKRPLIGITCSQHSRWLPWLLLKTAAIILGIRSLTLTPANRQDISKCHGFILMGGVDVDPIVYGQKRQEGIDYEAPRDLLELEIVQRAVEKKLPLLGICRGMQIINVAMKGTLHREVGDVFTDFLPTNSLLGKVFARRTVELEDGSQLSRILQSGTTIRVNSLHHQAVKDIGENLQVVAREANGLVQAVESKKQALHPFLIGVQWHPELMLHDRLAWRLLRAFKHSLHVGNT